VGPRVGLEAVAKEKLFSLTPPGIDPRSLVTILTELPQVRKLITSTNHFCRILTIVY
jgi:hypothetical protein